MPSRRLVCFALVLPVLVLSVCLVPAGHGSFSSAYGPTAVFRGLRAALLLMSLVVAAIKFQFASESVCAFAISRLAALHEFAEFGFDSLTAISPLRC